RCILPCTFLPGGDTLIHWMKMHNKNIIHSYYDNKDQLGSQIPSFQSRTSLFQDQISRGNASLLLMWVKVEDQGRYMCYSSTDIDNSENVIELKVEGQSPPPRKLKMKESTQKMDFNKTLFENVSRIFGFFLWKVLGDTMRNF
uniref:Ig-like domain-containing protein n=1 Tax=Takifugu rubripes TaxID=31033 RepID=A0A3B5KM58_TAKRU